MSIKSNFFLLIVKPKYSTKSSTTPPNSQILRQILKYSAKFSSTPLNFQILRQILKYSAKSPNTPQISVYLDQVQLKGRSTWWSWSQVQLSSQARIVVLETNSTKYSSLISWT